MIIDFEENSTRKVKLHCKWKFVKVKKENVKSHDYIINDVSSNR